LAPLVSSGKIFNENGFCNTVFIPYHRNDLREIPTVLKRIRLNGNLVTDLVEGPSTGNPSSGKDMKTPYFRRSQLAAAAISLCV
jgi:hypothetical protein